MRQLQMMVERGFILPAGVDKEEPLIADRAESFNLQTTGLLARWDENRLDRGRHGMLQAFLGVTTGENENFGCHCGVFSLNFAAKFPASLTPQYRQIKVQFG